MPGPGQPDAQFQEVVADIFNCLFRGHLLQVALEYEIDGGMKRLDILYRNVSERGFADLHNRHRIHCPYIPVECKNYSADPENPEIDQLIGRFGRNLGSFWLSRLQSDRSFGQSGCPLRGIREGRSWVRYCGIDREEFTQLGSQEHAASAMKNSNDIWSDLRQRLDRLLL